MIKKYIKLKSLTWWSAVAAIGYGIYNMDIETILAGLAGIGLRGAVHAEQD